MKLFRFALRSLLHFKLYTGINILGLALSLTCVIIIFRYVHGEFTVDRFHSNLDRIYTTTMEGEWELGKVAINGVGMNSGDTEGGLVDIRRDAGIEMHSKFMIWDREQITVDGRAFTVDALATDTVFLAIMDYPIIRGGTNIHKLEDAFITEALGKRLFGDEDPLGKTFEHSSGQVLTVTGILGVPPNKSVMPFDLLINRNITSAWFVHPYTLILLYPNVDVQEFNKTYSEFKGQENRKKRYQLLPIKDIYFSDIEGEGFIRGNKMTTLVLILVGIMLLCIGVVNFINIYTAVVLRRGREFGMKKVFGASGGRVFLQLLIENAIMIVMALVIALILTAVFNPVVKNILGFEQYNSLWFDFSLFAGLLIVIPLLTTVFPYLRYNYTAPIASLQSVGKTGGRSATRRIFLVFQYIVTLVMITASLFFVRQLSVMVNTDPGFRTKDVIQVPFFRMPTNYERYQDEKSRNKMMEEQKKMVKDFEHIKKQMDESPLFSAWTYGQNPTQMNSQVVEFNAPDGESHELTMMEASTKWMDIFEIHPVQGEMWEEMRESPGIVDGVYSQIYPKLILTESTMKLFGFTDYTEARLENKTIPTYFRMQESSTEGRMMMSLDPVYEPFEVAGVVKDVHAGHLSKQGNVSIAFVYVFHSQYNHPLTASIVPGRRQEAIEFLRQLHADTFGGDFEYSFVEEDVKAIYKEDRKVTFIYSIFTLVAILISALGLYSMSLYDVQQRHKEIAIRKVNGATTSIIIVMLLKRYFNLLLLAFVISLPIGWFVIQRYLQGFAYKAAIPWWIFLTAFGITAGVSLLTLIWQTKKAADTNPAAVVRKE